MKSRAFTLIELLVVVAVIVVLMAILLPSLGQARSQAATVTCLSKLRQLAIADQIYLSSDGRYHVPVLMGETGRWRNNSLFRSGLGIREEVFDDYPASMICPLSYAMTKPVRDKNTGLYQIMYSYGMNAQGTDLGTPGNRPACVGFSQGSVARPGSTVLFMDGLDWQIRASWTPPLAGCAAGTAGVYAASGLGEGLVDMGLNVNTPAYRHAGKINFAFFDGHGETWTYPQVQNKAVDKVRCWNVSILNVTE